MPPAAAGRVPLLELQRHRPRSPAPQRSGPCASTAVPGNHDPHEVTQRDQTVLEISQHKHFALNMHRSDQRAL